MEVAPRADFKYRKGNILLRRLRNVVGDKRMAHYTMVSMNPSRDEYWQIHKLNCKDALKCKAQGMSVWDVEAESPRAAATKELDDVDSGSLRIDMGYSESDFREMPCCKEAK